MTKFSDNDDLDETNYLIWSFMGVTLMVTMSFILAFPMSIIVSIIVILCVYITHYIRSGYYSTEGIKYRLKSFSGNKSENYLSHSLTFLCMNCGTGHEYISCPICGSKAVRAA